MAERAAEAKILRLGLLIEVLEYMGMKLDMHRGKRSSVVSVRNRAHPYISGGVVF